MVTKLDRYTSTSVLLKQCGWMPVRQLMGYHSLVLVHKTVENKTPDYLFKKIMSGGARPNTRQAVATTAALAAEGISRQPVVDECHLELTRKSWCWSGVLLYNRLPIDIKLERKLSTFKTRLRKWVTCNIDS